MDGMRADDQVKKTAVNARTYSQSMDNQTCPFHSLKSNEKQAKQNCNTQFPHHPSLVRTGDLMHEPSAKQEHHRIEGRGPNR